MDHFVFFLFFLYLIGIVVTSPIPHEDPEWKNDLDNNQNLEWYQFPSTTAEKRSFILKYPDDKEILQSSEQHSARLIGTAHLASRDSPSCLTFIYQITGDKSNKLSVIIDKQHIWRSRLVQKHGQTQVQLNISSSTTTGLTRTATRIAFDGQLTDNLEIKLENILTNHQPCPSSIKSSPSRTIRSLTSKTVPGYDCTFEQDMCGWTQGQNTTLDWFREQPASNPLADVIGPLIDHTYGNSTGYYVTCRKEIPDIRFSDIDISALVSPRLPDNTAGPMCADWWYMMHGTDDTELNLFLVANENFTSLKPFWRRSGNQGRHWHHGRVQIDPGNQITRVMYYIFARWNIRSEVSLDDLTLIDGPCIKSDFYTIDCTFEEEHICGYFSDPTGQFPWNRGQGSTPSALTGASQDHILGTAQGHFMYIGNPQKAGYKARLISVAEEPEKGRCLEFWYHMYGQNIGQLNVYANTNTSNNDVRTLLWSRGANIGDVWRKALISTEYTVPFRIIFEGVIGNGIEGDIAVDDIQRLSKSCKEPNNCDFENDNLCGWENIKTDQFDWEITSGASSTGTFASGPFQDHTFGTDEGSYAYIDRNKNRNISDTAILVSQSMTSTGVSGMCLEFFYHMYGLGASRLTVYLQMEGFQPLPIWTLADEQEDAWFQGKVGFVANNEHSILIEGKITQYGEGGIGLDDISITSGYCTLLPQHAVPESGLTTIVAAPITKVTTPSHPPTRFDCDFESDACASWSIISKPELTWTRAQGVSATQDDAHNPLYDHTGNQAHGYYLLLKPNTTTPFPNNNITSELRSSTMTDNPQCLEFWYFMYGPHVGTLNVEKFSGAFSQLRWSTTGGKGYEWLHAQVNLQSSTSNPTQFNIAIEGTWSGDNRGSIAIDDIILLNGTCRTSSDQCDFDSDDSICGFQYSTTGQFNWTRGLASVVQAGVNPDVDHTTQTGEGYYMLAEGKNRNANDRALLLTSIQDRTTGSCLHFWYFQHAATKQMKLNVYVLSQSSILWSHDGSLDNRWLYAQININSPSQSWQAVFESEVLAENPDASVVIDDVSITRGLCPKPGDCTFESGLCGWTNGDSDSNMDWLVGQGIHSFGTGPQYDHTTNTAQGKYLMIETSFPTVESDRARLQSVVFDETNGDSRCFRFWYHMFGESIGTLNVYLFNGTYTRLWSLSGDRGNNWYEGQVSYVSSIRHQIIVEGIAGIDYLGDISIDDFTFTTSNCSIRPIHDAVATVETTTLRTTLAPQSSLDCNFEQGVLCSTWSYDVSADFRWEVSQGQTSSVNTGPATDHTYGTPSGWYIYMDASYPQQSNQRCRIQTEEIEGQRCIQFWYHMYGMNVDTLNIYIKINGQLNKPVWTRSRNQGNLWLKGQYAVFPPANTKYQIVFEGIVGQSFHGDIALDDIVVYDSCPNENRLCTFEDASICNYVNDASTQYNWVRTTGDDPLASGSKPTTDHTDGTSNGAYMLIDISKASSTIINQRARLMSQTTSSNGEQCIEFWYYTDADILNTSSKLNLFIRSSTTTSNSSDYLIWSRSISNERQWRISQQRIPDGLALSPYQVIFEGVVYKSGATSPVIAIDDVFIRDRACLEPGNCDFENGMCTWMSLLHFGNASWVIGSGSSPSPYSGPQNDHTLGNTQGQYLFLNSLFTAQQTVVAAIQSETFEPTSRAGRCITFWYVMRGSQIDHIDVNITSTQGTTMIWSFGTVDQGESWHFASVGYYADIEHNIVIEGTVTAQMQGYYAIDDIDIRDNYCETHPTNAVVTILTTTTTIATTTATTTIATTTIGTTTIATTTITTTIGTTTITTTIGTATIARTTIATTTITTTIATTTTTSVIEVTPPSEDEPNLALILGLSMGIGISALLLIIGGLICYLKTRFPKAKVEPAAATNTTLSTVTDIPLVPINTTEKNSTLVAVVV